MLQLCLCYSCVYGTVVFMAQSCLWYSCVYGTVVFILHALYTKRSHVIHELSFREDTVHYCILKQPYILVYVELYTVKGRIDTYTVHTFT